MEHVHRNRAVGPSNPHAVSRFPMAQLQSRHRQEDRRTPFCMLGEEDCRAGGRVVECVRHIAGYIDCVLVSRVATLQKDHVSSSSKRHCGGSTL